MKIKLKLNFWRTYRILLILEINHFKPNWMVYFWITHSVGLKNVVFKNSNCVATRRTKWPDGRNVCSYILRSICSDLTFLNKPLVIPMLGLWTTLNILALFCFWNPKKSALTPIQISQSVSWSQRSAHSISYAWFMVGGQPLV